MDAEFYWLKKADPKRKNLEIVDDIYERAEKKIDEEIDYEDNLLTYHQHQLLT
jgi:hypothetical protein